jgi:PPM family protein phosphatase
MTGSSSSPLGASAGPRLRISACTETGARRGNEDDLRWGHGVNGHYVVLADGAGGHARGAEASQRAVDCMQRVMTEAGVAFSPANLTQMVRLAHFEIQHHQSADRPEARMHTTLVALWVEAEGRHVLWTHVGDSRLYRVRQGHAELLTQDDSVVQHMVQAGLITAAQSRTHPQKNHLLSALGVEGDVDPHTVVRPIELLEGDAYLLCSDGWWDHFEPADLANSLQRAADPEAWLADMKAEVQAHAQPRQDNFSAIAVWAGEPSQVTLAARLDETIPRATVPQ